jgi:hypothetical protein
MKKKLGLYILLSLVAAASAFAQENEPSSFPYNQIPFGKPMDQVLNMVETGTVVEDKELDIDFVQAYSLSLFQGGVYSWWGVGAYLASTCAKKYTVTYSGWDSIKKIDLYFACTFGKDDYTLMTVRKTQKANGDYKNVYASYKTTITTALGGLKPKETQVQWCDLTLRAQGSWDYGLVGQWTTSGKDIYLLVHNELFTAGDPDIVYVSQAGVAKYLKACAAYEADKKKNDMQNNSANF